jgi:hypothetical protein
MFSWALPGMLRRRNILLTRARGAFLKTVTATGASVGIVCFCLFFLITTFASGQVTATRTPNSASGTYPTQQTLVISKVVAQ